MSLWYKYEFVVSPVTDPRDAAVIKAALPYVIDGHRHDEDENLLSFWGESSLSASFSTEDRHLEIQELLSRYNVVSRWRIVEFDEWDDVYGEGESDNGSG